MIQASQQKRIFPFKWTDYDSYTVQKNDISVLIHHLKSYDLEVKTMKTYKFGRKFTHQNVLFALFALLRDIFHLSYSALPKMAEQFPTPFRSYVPHDTPICRYIQNLDLAHQMPQIDFTNQ